jgi:ribonuclease BN (tRNA processing enzyme)
MDVEILGHWAGAPAGAGACSSYVVRSEQTILLDVGPGSLSMIQERSIMDQINTIIVSHMHQDHMLDLFPFAKQREIRVLHGVDTWPHPQVLVPRNRGPEVLNALVAVWGRFARGNWRSANTFSDAFTIVEYDEHDTLEVGDLSLSFHRTSHAEPCYAPRLTDGRSAVVYTADAGLTEGLIAHAADADLLLSESTFLDTPVAVQDQLGHMTGAQAATLAQRAGVGQLVLTHFGPREEWNSANVARAAQIFDGSVGQARPGAMVQLR